MPELPEVETIVRSLAPKLRGLEIASCKLFLPSLIRGGNSSLLKKLIRRKILDLSRRGKMILIHCQGHWTLLFHLKMTGQLLFVPANELPDKHTHFILSFKGHERELRFRDVRKFGFLRCLKVSCLSSFPELQVLGPEPLELSFSSFRRLFKGRQAQIKSLLLNQTFMAGIGNIYSDEILFKAKLHPQTSASCLRTNDLQRLWRAMKSVLKEAIALRGSSIRDFKDSEGREGDFQKYHKVYGKESLPCPRCAKKIVRLRLGGRSSYYCPRCQKKTSKGMNCRHHFFRERSK